MFPMNSLQGSDLCCLRPQCAKGVVPRVNQRGCLQGEQEGSPPALVNVGHGGAVFSIELAQQKKENKKGKCST